MSAESSRAVFLSYASQDAEAARRICDALRAAGVEVWFDQNELVGGDAWDQKIRRQIKECALFVPIISANTQARTEGYFRLEWRLADQRTHLMAKGRAFLLPVVIDDTRDADAHVPDSFTEVQWMRLDVKDTPETLATRVARLLGGEGAGPVADRVSGPRPSLQAKRVPARSWLVTASIAVALVGAALYFTLRPRRGAEETAPLVAGAATIATGAAEKSAPAAAPLSEAQKLVARARALALQEQLDEVTREDFALADQLLKKAVELDPLDGEAWAAYALCSCGQISLQYDSSQARRQAALSAAQKAMKLAPDSNAARFAWAMSYRFQESVDRNEVLRLHRELVAREPDNKWVLRQAGRAFEVFGLDGRNRNTADHDEAMRYYDRAAALPGGDVIALRIKADLLCTDGRYAESEETIDRALQLRPSAGHLYTSKIRNLIALDPDLSAAQRVAEKIPPAYLLDDQGAYAASWVWLWSRQPERSLAVLRGLTHDYLDSRYYIGPKAYLTGAAHFMAGRREAALADWRIALQKVELRLAAEPGSLRWLRWKAELLALTGERAAAENALQICEQTAGAATGRATESTAAIYLALGRSGPVWDYIEARIAQRPDAVFVGDLRHSPGFDPLRAEPRFQELLQQAEKSLAAQRSGVATADQKSAAADKSVAVLAFADLSAAHDSEYFSDGISEELLNVLANVPGLKVTARTSAFFFKGKNLPIPEIAQKLGVGYVIEGSVQRAGERVKITAQLIKAADGFHVWSETFTRDAKDVFAVEEEIAGLIAKQLSLKLGASSAAATARVNPEAFELYLQGRQQWNLRTPPALAKAEESFNRALALDPKLIRAHAGLADVALLRGQVGQRIDFYPDRQAPALAAIVARIEQALALDPNLAETHTSLGGARLFSWDLAGAERELRQAIALNPNYGTAHQWLGRALTASGRMDEGLAELKLAASIDPLSSRIVDNYALALMLAGRLTEALAVIDRSLAVRPGQWQATNSKIEILLQLHRDEEALALVREIGVQDPTYRIGPPPSILARVGLRREAESVFKTTPDGPNDAGTLLALDRREEALATLTTERIGVLDLDALLYLPTFDGIRGEPRFVRMIEGIGLTEAHARAQAWRAAHPAEKPEAKK